MVNNNKPLLEPPATSGASAARPSASARKQCIVNSCPELIGPSMWHIHMTLHAKGGLPAGRVPSEWLEEQNSFICPRCFSIVSNSRQTSHSQRCSQRLEPLAPPQLHTPISSQANQDLPTFEEVCQLNHPTLRFVPAKAKPVFARALSMVLKGVILWNSEEAWLKLFMFPKCVLPPLKRRGNHAPHTSIESLCNMWLQNDLATLWSMASKPR